MKASVNYERKLGGVGSKGVYQEGNVFIAASSNGDCDEPSLQCNPASSSTR